MTADIPEGVPGDELEKDWMNLMHEAGPMFAAGEDRHCIMRWEDVDGMAVLTLSSPPLPYQLRIGIINPVAAPYFEVQIRREDGSPVLLGKKELEDVTSHILTGPMRALAGLWEREGDLGGWPR